MEILSDRDLIPLVDCASPRLAVEGVRQVSDWYDVDSPVQPCSLDLTIGEIFVPDRESGEMGSVDQPLRELVLSEGETAVIVTRESFKLASDLAGIGFPPSRTSIRGLLMTNPGHIDPGSEGPLHFTVINMARAPISLRAGDVIFTVLLFRLSSPVGRGLASRQGTRSPYNIRDLLSRLSPDFLSLENRALAVAKEEIRSAELTAKLRQVWIPVVSAIVAAFASLVVALWNPGWKAEVNRLDKEIATISARTSVESRVGELEKWRSLQEQTAKAPAPETKPAQPPKKEK